MRITVVFTIAFLLCCIITINVLLARKYIELQRDYEHEQLMHKATLERCAESWLKTVPSPQEIEIIERSDAIRDKIKGRKIK